MSRGGNYSYTDQWSTPPRPVFEQLRKMPSNFWPHTCLSAKPNEPMIVVASCVRLDGIMGRGKKKNLPNLWMLLSTGVRKYVFGPSWYFPSVHIHTLDGLLLFFFFLFFFFFFFFFLFFSPLSHAPDKSRHVNTLNPYLTVLRQFFLNSVRVARFPFFSPPLPTPSPPINSDFFFLILFLPRFGFFAKVRQRHNAKSSQGIARQGKARQSENNSRLDKGKKR